MAESIVSTTQQSSDSILSGLAMSKQSIYFSSQTITSDNGGRIDGFYEGTSASLSTSDGVFVGLRMTLNWTRIAVYDGSTASTISPGIRLMNGSTAKLQKQYGGAIPWQTATSPGVVTWNMNPMLVSPSDYITGVSLGIWVAGQIIKVRWSVSGYIYVWKFAIQS